jgi:Domain of unknown function (DUF1788)
VSSSTEGLKALGDDLLAKPMRIVVHPELPFAVYRYDPRDEWPVRRAVKNLAARLEAEGGRRVKQISLSELMWRAVDESEGMEALVELEREDGFEAAQRQVNAYLSDPIWNPLRHAVLERLAGLDPVQDIAFLVRAAALTPNVYHMSRLLEELQGKTEVPTVLFYPGSIEGALGLRFMALPSGEVAGNYRVKIYD